MVPQNNIQVTGCPDAEINIDSNLVLKLLSDQHPDLLGMHIEFVSSGWDNVMFRLGRQFCVRVPCRKISAELICNEQKWLSQIAIAVSIQVPVPIKTGLPTSYYPWHWSVIPWIEGKSADEVTLEPSQAGVIGEFLKALHSEAPSGFPINPYRGIPLSGQNEKTLERLKRLSINQGLDVNLLQKKWDRAIAATNDTLPRIIHGDIHPQNILANEGKIVGIIDWGDMCVGDIATDLASAWMLFREPIQRKDFFDNYGKISEDTFHRAEGWAIMLGSMFLETGLLNNRKHEVMGRKTLENLANQPI